jgi:hypothetical protein
MTEYLDIPEGHRVVRIYRNGSWLEDSPGGQRSRVSFAEATDDDLMWPSPPVHSLDIHRTCRERHAALLAALDALIAEWNSEGFDSQQYALQLRRVLSAHREPRP